MAPVPQPAQAHGEWDGQTLRLHAPGCALLDIELDGSPFLRLDADAAARTGITFPFSPSGHAQASVCIRANDTDARLAEFSIAFGSPGILPAAPTDEATLLPLAQSLRVPVDVEPMAAEVAIVVPVYNAAAAVRRCLDSVLEHTHGRARLIIIDDASPDADIAPLLDRYRGIDAVEVLANPVNRGFTATVNRGIEHAGCADVVLLNADTEVGPHWLTGLRRALHARADIATATAVSDNAGAFSVPELEHENPWPPAWTFTDTARALWQDAGLAYPQLPTGNGFCMLIRRSVLDAIGAFDVEAFPQGYGEENDFCQRACAAGFRHVIAGNVYVGHARSQSFGQERREALGRAGMAVLRERWPNYEADVGATLFSFERRVLDWRVRSSFAAASRHLPQPRQLWIDGAPAGAWHLHAAADTLRLIDAQGQLRESAALAQFDAERASAWLQDHAIEALVSRNPGKHAWEHHLIEQGARLGVCHGPPGSQPLPSFIRRTA